MNLNDLLQAAIIVNVFASMIRIATPLLLASMGQLVTQRAGILNLGVEGTMLIGAYTGWIIAERTESLWIPLLGALLAGGVMGLIMAVMAINLKIDQTITGITLNLFASGLTLFSYRIAYADYNPSDLPIISLFGKTRIPVLSKIPYLGEILFSQQFLTYIALLLVPVIWGFLYRTRQGLIIRSLGENPRAADLKGIPVYRYQYAAVIFGSTMAGMAGAFVTLASSAKFVPNITAGRGWLALVILIAGNWRPGRVLFATLAFAFIDALQLQFQGIGVQFPYQILLAMPYVFAILVMTGSRMRQEEPASLGVPYLRE